MNNIRNYVQRYDGNKFQKSHKYNIYILKLLSEAIKNINGQQENHQKLIHLKTFK